MRCARGAKVKTGDRPDMMRGALQILSPLELVWAFVLGVGGLLSSGISAEDKLLLRKATLTTPVEIHTIDDLKSRLFKCHALREGITQGGESVRRSATARMMDIIESKNLMDNATTGQPSGSYRNTCLETIRARVTTCARGCVCFHSIVPRLIDLDIGCTPEIRASYGRDARTLLSACCPSLGQQRA